MPDKKYIKNIVIDDLMPPQSPEFMKYMDDQARAGNTIDRTLLLGIQDSIVKGSFFTGCEWVWGLTGEGPVSIEMPHNHSFDEIIGLIGSIKRSPRGLGGEVEFWIDDEAYIITNTCLIFIPKGINHCPIIFRRVDSPIFMFETGNNTVYLKSD
jgi:hypothetical protein